MIKEHIKMTYSALFSILFISVCIISLIIAILVIKSNFKASVSRCFLALIISVNFWSAGLGIANIAPDVETCELWRRVSAVGWGTAYAIILHFILIFTGYITLLKKRWLYIILYLPAVISVLAFAIPNGLNPNTYQLIQTDFGWVNVAGIADYNIWDWIFLFYYVGYTVIGLVLILIWGIKSSDRNIKKQSRSLFLSFTAALVIASLTDMLLGNIFARLPQIAPIILIIPIVTIYRIIRNYSFIISEPIGKMGSYTRIFLCVIIYVLLMFSQIVLSTGRITASSQVIQQPTALGIITLLQMIIVIYLVLKENILGYIAAILLNIVSIISSISFIIRTGTTSPLPGTISYIAAVLIVILINDYKKKTAANILKIDNQRLNLEESEKKLYYMAYYDSLTGIHNKDWFIDNLKRTIEIANNNKMLGIIFADMDSFKAVNDTMGHSAGDIVLQQISSRLSSCIRPGDAIARFGGDEFLIMISNLNSIEELYEITDKIMNKFKNPVLVQEKEHFVTTSLGVSVYPTDGLDSETLIKNADIAMYLAKNQGKNKCIYCSTDIKNDTIMKMKLTNNLYRALEKNELFLHFQPQVKADTKEIIGFEALLRWNNDEYGIVTPNVFIPMAEQTGMIMPIGLWVLQTACEQLQSFQRLYNKNLTMSVNLSLEQLRDNDIVDKFSKIIKDTGVNINNIQVEITESIAFNEDTHVLERVKELKELGISVSIDDFGTGFSSLSRLKTFPIDLLKIDIDFVSGISSGSEKDMAIIKSIIQISENLKIDILAEGVETEEQYEYLKDNGCGIIQGYYFYKPMAASDIERLLSYINS